VFWLSRLARSITIASVYDNRIAFREAAHARLCTLYVDRRIRHGREARRDGLSIRNGRNFATAQTTRLQVALLRAREAAQRDRLAPQFPASLISRFPTCPTCPRERTGNNPWAPWWKKRHVGGQPGDNNEHCDLRGCVSRPIGRFSPPLRARPRGESEPAGRGLAAAYNPNNAQCARRTT